MVAHTKKTLLMFALIGRSIETLCGIRLFQHKTKHKKYYISVPVLQLSTSSKVSLYYQNQKYPLNKVFENENNINKLG